MSNRKQGFDLFEIVLVPETVDELARVANLRDVSIEEEIGRVVGDWAAKKRREREEIVWKCLYCGNDEFFKAYEKGDLRHLIEKTEPGAMAMTRDPQTSFPAVDDTHIIYDTETLDEGYGIDEVICEKCDMIIYGRDKGSQA